MVDYACKAPAGICTSMGGVAKMPQGLLRKDPCSRCGGDVCTVCSIRTKGKVICNNCRERETMRSSKQIRERHAKAVEEADKRMDPKASAKKKMDWMYAAGYRDALKWVLSRGRS